MNKKGKRKRSLCIAVKLGHGKILSVVFNHGPFIYVLIFQGGNNEKVPGRCYDCEETNKVRMADSKEN